MAILLCACGGLAHASAKHAPEPRCGAAAAATAASTAGSVAERIYQQELNSAEVIADRRQVEENGPLLDALAARETAAVTAAVSKLVYSGTHIVRLRVMAQGRVLADVGGPYIIAPVSGTLRLGGRTVGRYVLSVQDDLGFVKLETRFIGVPLLLLTDEHRIPVEGTLVPGPAQIPPDGPVTLGGVDYQTYSFTASAFPEGTLTVRMLIPSAVVSSAASCLSIKATELQRISRTSWERFAAIGAPAASYVLNNGGLTGTLTYVRSGSHQLAGTTTPGPARLPVLGVVSYRGTSYEVRSFASTLDGAPVRVYLLVR